MSSASSSNAPCAACKVQRRKCTQDCVFAPYFPPDQPQKFCNVHKVFGASNVSKLLQELTASQREDAVNSLAYEAEARLRDPVYGCVGLISLLQHRLREVQSDLVKAKKELANYVGSQATMIPILQPPNVSYNGAPTHHPQQQQFPSIGTNNNPSPMIGIPNGAVSSSSSSYAGAQDHVVINVDPHHQQQQQQFLEAQQLAAVLAAREQQEMLRMTMEQKLHQPQEFVRVVNSTTSGFDPAGASTGGGSSSHGFNPSMAGGGSSSNLSPVLALGSFNNSDNYHVNQPQQPDHHHQQLPHQHLLREQLLLGQTPQPVQTQEQLLLHQHQTQMLRQLDGEKGKSVGPSC